jgi:hypothetical protein
MKMIKKLYRLISENGTDISIGRVMLWLLTMVLLYYWVGKQIYILFFIREYNSQIIALVNKIYEIPDGLISTWTTILSYNAFKKLPINTNNKPKKKDMEIDE